MTALIEALKWARTQMTAAGRWLWSLAGPEPLLLFLGFILLLFVTFGVGKIWNMAVSDTGYYVNANPAGADFILMRGQTYGYTLCWTKIGTNEIEACVDLRKR